MQKCEGQKRLVMDTLVTKRAGLFSFFVCVFFSVRISSRRNSSPPNFWEKDMEKWKQKFEQSNKITEDDMKKIQRNYHYKFSTPTLEDSKAKTYSRFCTVDPILLKGSISQVIKRITYLV